MICVDRQSWRPLRRKFPTHERKNRYPTERWTSRTTKLSIIICFRTSTTGLARFAPCECRKAAVRFVFPRTSKDRHQLFGDLRTADYLRNLDAQAFASRAAHFLCELNAIHAFREGNGRSQLTFLVLLADHAGHPLKIERLDPTQMLAAMIAGFDGDEQPLANQIHDLSKETGIASP